MLNWLNRQTSHVSRQIRSARRRQKRSRGELLEDRTLLTFTLDAITPSLEAGFIPAGVTDLALAFNEDVGASSGTTSFELRSVGADGLLGNSDDEILDITSARYSGATVTLAVPPLVESVYRLTVFDSLENTNGDSLDGDNDGTAGGDFRDDFVVTAESSDLVSEAPSHLIATTPGYYSSNARTSADGSLIVFSSTASNLVEGDDNDAFDVFLTDMRDGSTTRLSNHPNSEYNVWSTSPDISGDGRLVVFQTSNALVPEDTNNSTDIYLKDLSDDSFRLISTNAAGEPGNSSSLHPRISSDGRFVVFSSRANNLVPGDTNSREDIFVKNLADGSIVRASLSNTGDEGDDTSERPRISADGRVVVFTSDATNLVVGDGNGFKDIYAKDMVTGVIQRATVSASGDESTADTYTAEVSANGRYVVFESRSEDLVPDDTNNDPDIFVKDLQDGSMRRANTDSSGQQSFSFVTTGPSISEDGRFVTFHSTASDLVDGHDTGINRDVYLKDLSDESIRVVGVDADGAAGNAGSTDAVLNPDATFVIFETFSTNFTTGDTNSSDDIYRKNLVNGQLDLVTKSAVPDVGGSRNSKHSSLSDDGRFVAFESAAANLVDNDTNNTWDIFVRDFRDGSIERVSTSTDGVEGNNPAEHPSISADGRFVAFQSYANNVVSGDTNRDRDIFVRDRNSGVTTRVSTNSAGSQVIGDSIAPQISADGRYVAFESISSSLVSGDNNSVSDAFVKDLETGAVVRASTDAAGSEANGISDQVSISGDGRLIAFRSEASNLVPGDTNGVADVFVKDLSDGTIVRISVDESGDEATQDSYFPAVSADGKFVAFASEASLVDGEGSAIDVFVADLENGTLRRASVAQNSNSGSAYQLKNAPAISGDGRFVAFESYSTTFTQRFTGNRIGIVVKDMVDGSTRHVSVGWQGEPVNYDSKLPAISADGQFVAYANQASNIHPQARQRSIFNVFRTSLEDRSVVHLDPLSSDPPRAEVDAMGFGAGQLVQGPANAFDGMGRLQVGGVDFEAIGTVVDDSEVVVQIGSDTLAGLEVSREVRASAATNHDFTRTVDTFRNNTDSTINTEVRIVGNLGSNQDTVVFGTSDGDQAVETTDAWIGTDDADNTGSPAIVHYFRSDTGLNPVRVDVIEDNVFWDFSITVPAGESLRLAHFTILDESRAAVVAAANDLVTTTGFAGEAANMDAASPGPFANYPFGYDFGDNPDAFDTSLASNGPRHFIRSDLFMGAQYPDGESDAEASFTANGDDLQGIDDEDGLVDPERDLHIQAGQTPTVDIRVTNRLSSANLIGWIDYDGDRKFEASEAATLAIPAGTIDSTVTLTFPRVPNLFRGGTYARFRLTTDPNITTATPGGVAADGEVEDHLATIVVPEVELTVSTALGSEAGTTVVTVEATASGAVFGDQTVDILTSGDAKLGEDFTLSAGSILIPDGETSGTMTFTVVDDEVVESEQEAVTLTLANPSSGITLGVNGSREITISDDDTAGISVAAVEVSESDSGDSVAEFVITLDAEVDTDVVFDAGTLDGTATTADDDYVSASSSDITFPANSEAGTTATFRVDVKGDIVVELDESFSAELSNLRANDRAVSFTSSTAVGSILNDDNAEVTINDVSTNEVDAGGTNFSQFTISLSHPVDTPVTLEATTEDGSAVASVDYVPLTAEPVQFSVGDLSQTVTVNVIGDDIVELSEDFLVRLLNLDTGGRSVSISDATGNGTIVENDSAQLTINDAELLEGDDGSQVMKFAVTLDAQVDVRVGIDAETDEDAAISGDDFESTESTLWFPAGSDPGTTIDFEVPILGDSTVELDEALVARIFGVQSEGRDVTVAGAVAEGTIRNDDTATISIDDVSGIEGDVNDVTQLSFTVSLSNPVDVPVTLTATTADGSATVGESDYLAATGTLEVDAGTQTQTFVVEVLGDELPEIAEYFFVELSDLENGSRDVSFGDARGVATIEWDDALVVSSVRDTIDSDVAFGEFTLREAIAVANGRGVGNLTFAPILAGTPIVLTNGSIEVRQPLTISGMGARQTTISGNDVSRVFTIDDGADNDLIDVVIEGVTITNGVAEEGGGIANRENLVLRDVHVTSNVATAGSGGGILHSLGRFVVIGSTVSGNTATQGGGIELANTQEPATLSNVTISGNEARGSAAGLSFDSSTAVVRNSTVTANRADTDSSRTDSGGGIRVLSSDVTIHNTLVVGNFLRSLPNDVAFALNSGSSFNLIGSSAGGLQDGVNGNIVGALPQTVLEPLLSDNGGQAPTHNLVQDSPAIHAGSDAMAVNHNGEPLSSDGRLQPRFQATVDIGATEKLLATFDDESTTTRGTAVTVDVLSNDSPPEQTRVEVVSQPESGTATVVAGGIRYLPNPDFTGTDSFEYEAVLTPTNHSSAGVSAEEGNAVAIDGDWAIVGARRDDVVDTNAGAAFVYRREGETWVKFQELRPAEIAHRDRFGFSVAISNHTIVVGARLDDDLGFKSGSVYVFEYDATVDRFVQTQKLLDAEGSRRDQFGHAVDIDGDTLVVGARRDSSQGAQNSGAVVVFARSDSGWQQTQRIKPVDTETGDQFGSAVAVYGNTLAVGAWKDNEGDKTDNGSAYVFDRHQGGTESWGQVGKLVASDTRTNDWFGFSVDVAEDTVVVGKPIRNPRQREGAAYIFERASGDPTGWSERTVLMNPNAAVRDQYGHSVRIDGDTVVVGARLDATSANNAGAAYVFERRQDGTGSWGLREQHFGQQGEQFGFAADIDGDTIIVGANLNDAGGKDSGAVYFLDRRSVIGTVTVQVNQNQRSASGLGTGDVDLLELDQLEPIVAAAREYWRTRVALSDKQQMDLSTAVFEVASLNDNRLGFQSGLRITIDADAAGHGWYVDPTPLDLGDDFIGSRMDLLSNVTHELGHVLGYSDLYESDSETDVMFGYLALGRRSLGELDSAFAALSSDLVGEILA